MNNYLDFETFNNGCIGFSNDEDCLIDLTNTLNNNLERWTLVKVPIKHEMIDDLTEIIKYEYRYRLYLSDVYKELGMDEFIANQYDSYYWEKDKDGNYTDNYLP